MCLVDIQLAGTDDDNLSRGNPSSNERLMNGHNPDSISGFVLDTFSYIPLLSAHLPYI
jgi:hypothetical protein